MTAYHPAKDSDKPSVRDIAAYAAEHGLPDVWQDGDHVLGKFSMLNYQHALNHWRIGKGISITVGSEKSS